MSIAKSILVTGATGNQGGAVLRHLATHTSASQFNLLAVTRNASSESAKKIVERHPNVLVVQGDLNDTPALFKSAQSTLKNAGKPDTIWGVFSVQVSFGGGATAVDSEVKQGKALVDEALKCGVKHFVYTSVDRGGNEKSFNNPTTVPHFQSKNELEQYILQQAGSKCEKMSWTILRPTAFMDNIVPGMQSKVFLTTLRDTMQGKATQFVALNDIGLFGAKAFREPESFKGRAVGLAGESLTYDQMNEHFLKVTGGPAPSTFSFLGSLLKMAIKEVALMLNWFKEEGYNVDVAKLRQEEPQLTDFPTWLRETSKFEKV